MKDDVYTEKTDHEYICLDGKLIHLPNPSTKNKVFVDGVENVLKKL